MIHDPHQVASRSRDAFSDAPWLVAFLHTGGSAAGRGEFRAHGRDVCGTTGRGSFSRLDE